MRLRVLRIDLHGLAEAGDGLVVLPARQEDVAQVVVQFGRVGLDGQCRRAFRFQPPSPCPASTGPCPCQPAWWQAQNSPRTSAKASSSGPRYKARGPLRSTGTTPPAASAGSRSGPAACRAGSNADAARRFPGTVFAIHRTGACGPTRWPFRSLPKPRRTPWDPRCGGRIRTARRRRPRSPATGAVWPLRGPPTCCRRAWPTFSFAGASLPNGPAAARLSRHPFRQCSPARRGRVQGRIVPAVCADVLPAPLYYALERAAVEHCRLKRFKVDRRQFARLALQALAKVSPLDLLRLGNPQQAEKRGHEIDKVHRRFDRNAFWPAV